MAFLSAASSWAMQRLLKVALKRNLKHVFQTEIDVDQLAVGGGGVTLRELVFSLDWINSHLAGSGWEAAAGFVGSVQLRLPLSALTSLACEVELKDVLITVRPSAASPAASTQPVAAAGEGGPAPSEPPWDEGGQQEAAVAEGIRVVAAGLEAMLQRLKVQVQRVAIRLEVPAGRHEAWHSFTLQVDQLGYGPAAEAEAAEPEGGGLHVQKTIAFSGLSLQLQPADAEMLPPVLTSGDSSTAGASGAVDISVAWQLEGQRIIKAHVGLDPLHVHLCPTHLSAVLVLLGAVHATAPNDCEQQQQQAPAAAHQQSSVGGRVEPWGTQSLLDSLLLPDCERMVSDTISGQEEVDEFFDAKSLLGSLQSTFSECGLAASSMHHAHALAVSVHKAPVQPADRWSLRLATPEVSVSVQYPSTADLFQPQLVAEVSQLEIDAQHFDGPGGLMAVTLGIAQLDMAEHLPFPRDDAGCSSQAAQLPEEMGRVPDVLPQLRSGRAAPSAAGNYPLPTLDAIQSTVAQLSSSVYQTALYNGSGVVPRVQIAPLLACGGTTGAGSLCLLASACHGSMVSLGAVLPPITLWLTQELVERLQSLAGVVLADMTCQQQQQRQPHEPAQVPGRTSIDDIVQELKDLNRGQTEPASPAIEFKLYAPSVTVIAGLGLSDSSTAAFRFLAMDLVGDERLPSGQGVDGARDVLAMLEEECVQPLVCVKLHQEQETQASCICTVAASSGGAYAIGSMQAAHLHESLLGGLYAETLARVSGSPDAGMLTIDVVWEAALSASAPAVLEAAWKHASGVGAELDAMRLRDDCFRGSTLSVTIRAPSIGSHLSQPTVAALMHLSDTVMQLAPAAPAAAGSAIQVSVLLEGALDCHLVPAGGNNSITIYASGIQCFVCSNVSGMQGASVLLLSSDAVRLALDEDPVLAGAPAAGQPGLEFVRLTRPTGEAYITNRRLVVPSESQMRACLSGCTSALDQDGLGMSWLRTVAAFFSPPDATGMVAPDAVTAESSGGFTLRLRQVALHHSPKHTQRTCVQAALLLGDGCWRSLGQGWELLLEDASLHLAPAERAAHASLASLDLLSAAGFSQVLAESALSVRVCQDGAATSGSTEVESKQLTVTLSQATATLAQALLQQLYAQPAGTPAQASHAAHLQASVLIDGGWTDDLANEPMTPPGSPPTLVEAPFHAHGGLESDRDEADGQWLGDSAPILQESYIAAPEAAPTKCRPAVFTLPTSFPRPATVLSLRSIKATVILADTFTTILMPEGDEEYVENVPASSEVQLSLDSLSICINTFGPGHQRLRRMAVALHDLEVRDSVQAVGSNKPRAWRRMLGYHASPTVPRDVDASIFTMVVDTQLDSKGTPEHSAAIALMPLKLHLDQHAVAFLQAFVDGLDLASTPAGPLQPVAAPIKIECLEISPFRLTVDYKPRQIDVAALARGHFVEALNLVPFGGVSLAMRHMCVYNMEASAAAAAIISAYLSDIVQHQAHKFVQGVAPIRSLTNITVSTGQLLAIPAEALFSTQQESGGRTLLSHLSDRDFQRSLRRGLANLARQVAIEAMNLTATAGGATASALDSQTYRAAKEQPAGIKDAVRAATRQVSSGLRSGSAVKAMAAGGAATRTLSLGARNALNPDHFRERQMNM